MLKCPCGLFVVSFLSWSTRTLLQKPIFSSLFLAKVLKEGCNFSAVNNATKYVTVEYVQDCMEKIGIDERTIVAAIPEVSIESRVAMLRMGKEKQAFNVLSIPVAEARTFLKHNIFWIVICLL